MPRRPHMQPPPFHPARPELVRPVRLDPAGLAGPTLGQSRGRQWRSTSHGFHLPAYVDGSIPEQRIVEAGHFLTVMASVTGWASLRWQGAEWFDGTCEGARARAVPIAVVRGSMRSQEGIAVTSEFIPPRDRTVVDGLRVTTAVCALAYEMRYAADARAAGRAFALAAAADLVSFDEMDRYKELLYHWIGVPVLRAGLALAEENAWSPREFDMCVARQLDAGLPRPLLNRPVFDLQGRHLGTPDLLDPVAGVAGQYNGKVHLLGRRPIRDLESEDLFRGVGLECFTLFSEDLDDRPRAVARMQAAYARGQARPASERRWTLTPPSWWVPTHTVELRRALTPAQRERYLGYRRTA